MPNENYHKDTLKFISTEIGHFLNVCASLLSFQNKKFRILKKNRTHEIYSPVT